MSCVEDFTAVKIDQFYRGKSYNIHDDLAYKLHVYVTFTLYYATLASSAYIFLRIIQCIVRTPSVARDQAFVLILLNVSKKNMNFSTWVHFVPIIAQQSTLTIMIEKKMSHSAKVVLTTEFLNRYNVYYYFILKDGIVFNVSVSMN